MLLTPLNTAVLYITNITSNETILMTAFFHVIFVTFPPPLALYSIIPLDSTKEKHLSHDRRFQKGNTDSNKNHRNGRTRTFDTLALRSTALPLSYDPRGRQQAFACCLVGFDVSRRPYAFGLIHATIISRKYPFVVTHFFIFLSGAFLSFPLNHTVCICHRKHER